MMDRDEPDTATDNAAAAHFPKPPSERGAWLLACALGLIGAGVLAAVLTGLVGRSTPAVPAAAPPPVLRAAATPAPGPAASASALSGAQVGGESGVGATRSSGGRHRGRGRS